MAFWPQKTLSIGIELTPTTLKVAALRLSKQKWEVVCVKQYPIPLNEKDVKELDKLAKEGCVVSAMDSREVLIRSLDIRLKNEKDIDEALEFQVEPHLPYSIKKGIIDSQILEKLSFGTRICFFSIRKDHLQKHIKALNDLPEIVTSVPSALASLSKLLGADKEPQLVLHVGKETSTLIATEGGKLTASSSLNLGSNAMKDPNFRIGLLKMVGSLEASFGQTPPPSLLLIGEDVAEANEIQEMTGKTVLIPTFSPFDLPSADLQKYCIAIGAAIHPLTDKPINFRQKEFCYPNRFKRIKKPLFTSCALLLALSVLLFVAGRVVLHDKKCSFTQEGLNFLASENKRCSEENFYQTLFEYEKNISSKQTSFPLLPKTPTAKEFLGWLTNHPKLSKKIDIIKFRYKMVQFPSFSNKKQRYRAEVELEFTTPNPVDARSFHDLLAQESRFIDTKKGVKWLAERGKYRATLSLIDRTHYM